MRKVLLSIVTLSLAVLATACPPPPPGVPQRCGFIITGAPTAPCSSTIAEAGVTVNNWLLFPTEHCDYEFTVNWRDGSPSEQMELVVETKDGSQQFFVAKHTYAEPGVYLIAVTGIGDALLCPEVHRTLEFELLPTAT